MSRNYVAMPAIRPRNAMIDFSPVAGALDSWRDQTNTNTRNAMMLDQMAQQQAQQEFERGLQLQREQRAADEFQYNVGRRPQQEELERLRLENERVGLSTRQMQIDAMRDERVQMAELQRMFTGGPPDQGPSAPVPETGAARFAAPQMATTTPDGQGMVRIGNRTMTRDEATATAEAMLLNPKTQDVGTAILKRIGNGTDSTKWGKTGAVFQGPDNRFYSVQFSEDGTRKVAPVTADGVPLAPSKGIKEVGDTIVDAATGQVIRNVGQNIFEAERQKKLGGVQADGQANLPKMKSAYRSAQIADKNLFRSLEKAKGMASPWTTGFTGNVLSYVKGSPSSDLAITLRQVKASLGFASLQQMRDNSPTGGALGQVTERELELLQNAEAALDQAQSLDEFNEAIDYLREIKTEYAQLRREAYEADVARFGQAAVPNPETGQGSSPKVRRYNPETGKIE